MNHPLQTNLGTFVRRSALLLAAVLLPSLTHATIVGPYTADTNTLFLVHFDESAGGSVATNVGLKAGNFITTTNSTTGNGIATPPVSTLMLGKSAYTGFGNSVSATNTDTPFTVGVIGFDGNANGVFNADVTGAGISVDAIGMTNLNMGETNVIPSGRSPFTIEALVNSTVTTLNANQEILCTDAAALAGGLRGFQFRLNSSGQLEFNFIASGASGAGKQILAAVPVSGAHAYAANTWFHAAVTYDGTNLFLYWTKVDPSSTACNQIGSGVAWLASITNGLTVGPLIIGNENRGASTENFRGLIDEVRISKIARNPSQMMFVSPAVTIVKQPSSQSIDYFQPVTFNVTVSSTTPVGYQWSFNNASIDAATNSSYSIGSVDLNNGGSYKVIITNTAGFAATSSPAILIVGSDHFLAHRWSFSGDTTDSVGGSTGTLVGAAAVSGGALVLNGTTGTYMDLPQFLIRNSNYTAVTFEFWATYNTSGNGARVFDFGNTNFVNFVVPPPENYVYFSSRLGANHTLGFAAASSESQVLANAPGNLDGQANYYVACVIDPPNHLMSIYTNGVLETSVAISAALESVIDEKCWIGRSLFVADAYLNASIDELRIYSGALSPGSVLQAFSQGPDVPLNAGPVAILVQPTNTTGAVGFPVSIIAAMVGKSPILSQWYDNGSAIAGATNPVLTFVPTLLQNGHVFNVRATNNVGGTNYAVLSSNAVLTVTIPATKIWAGVNGVDWNTSTLNWSNSTPALTTFAQFDGARFDDRGAVNQPNVNVAQLINLTSLVASNSIDYVLQTSGGGSLNGQAISVVKAGAGKFTIDVNNNTTGNTLIQSGTLQVGNNSGTGSLTGGSVTNNASLVFARSNGITVTNEISGTGTVTHAGAGDVFLSASNSYAGLTIVSGGGSLHPRNVNALGTDSVPTISTNGGRLYFDVNIDYPTEPLVIGGSAVALQKGGAGVSTLGGTIALVSDATLTVDGGATLNLTNAGGLSGTGDKNLTLAGTGIGNISGPYALGNGNLTVSGGTWTVAPSNNVAGLTTISGGTLMLTAARSLGQPPGSFNASQVTLSGGNLGAATNVTLDDGNIGIFVADSPLTSGLTVNANSTLTISNNITGGASSVLTKRGAGTLVLKGANDFFGTLNIDENSTTANGGTTVIANNGAIANILAIPGAPFINIRNNNAGISALALDGSSGSITVAPDIGWAGRNVGNASIVNLAGNNSISGNFTLNVGGGLYTFQSDSGTLTLSSGSPIPFSTPNTGRGFAFQGAGNIAVTTVIQDGSLDATSTTNVWMAVTKLGTGQVTLSAANTYSGTTTVSNGVLLITGSINSVGGVTGAGGILAGTGTIAGPVSIISGGGIEAGTTTAIGTLTLSSSLTLAGNTIVKINKTASTKDLFSGQTSVTYGGTLTVTNLSGTLNTNDTFTLFSPGTSASNFGSIIGTPGPNMHYSFTNGVLSVVAGTQFAENSTNITVNVSGNTLTLSWPADHLGWLLQAQTNSLATGLSTNWFDVPGSGSSTQSVITINAINSTVFYRLRHP